MIGVLFLCLLTSVFGWQEKLFRGLVAKLQEWGMERRLPRFILVGGLGALCNVLGSFSYYPILFYAAASAGLVAQIASKGFIRIVGRDFHLLYGVAHDPCD